ncbi:MAG: cell division protein FtsL [bacterium]
MRFFVLALATVAALVVSAIRVVSARHDGVDLAYRIAAATRTQRALTEEESQLRIDRAALLDPTRLEPIAVRHGFRVPSPDQIVVTGGGDGP